jgi:hypothetical protein
MGLPRTRLDLLLRRAGDVWVVIDPLDDRSLTLNPSAYWVLHHCEGRTDPQILAEELAQASGIPPARALDDVHACIAGFKDLGLLADG